MGEDLEEGEGLAVAVGFRSAVQKRGQLGYIPRCAVT